MEEKIKKITKSTPEQKEEWKDRLIEEAFIYQGREAGVIETITFDYDKLLSFISQELDRVEDRAREEGMFTREELQCILRWKDACDGEFNCLTLLPSSGEDWGKEEDIESAENKLLSELDKLSNK